MNLGVVSVEKKLTTVEKEIAMMGREDQAFRPFVLKVLPNPTSEPITPKVMVKVPTPFPYQSNRAVPWNYGVKVELVKEKLEDKEASKEGDGVTNVSATGGFTISGRKEKDLEGAIDDDEFLRVLKHSEYNIVDQLKKTPTHISLLSLIMSSEAHRKALQKFLDQAYVNPSITVENFDDMVNLIRKVSTISFTEDELVPRASKHTRALHIALKCAGCVVAKVLIDNGSTLNVLPTFTLANLSVDSSLMQSSSIVVRAFNGTRREVLGEIVLPLEIGPSQFNVNFQVMDIEPIYTMLLGRPWIHAAGAVPFTLHQKLKYIDAGRVITVKGEEDLLVSEPNCLPSSDIMASSKDEEPMPMVDMSGKGAGSNPWIHLDEYDFEEDTDTSNTFAKMIESHEKIVSPHNEDVQTINMGTEEEQKELKIVDNPEKDEMIAFFKEYLDVFA
ncbi:hypothetical protein L6164_008619 [Bauhinia variegata]|uniref:Uncharacterized protein n=1 Tax=Bauhinia variegata TaxID=167791 RepID=A0ACB9PHC2_BAUVA|nr:hypothetical protein L6164_008619 [Bauhinia variegata]